MKPALCLWKRLGGLDGFRHGCGPGAVAPDLEIDCVSVDNEKGAYFATEHLLKLGYHNIAIVLGPMENISSRSVLGYKSDG